MSEWLNLTAFLGIVGKKVCLNIQKYVLSTTVRVVRFVCFAFPESYSYLFLINNSTNTGDEDSYQSKVMVSQLSYLTQSVSSLPHVNSASKWGFCFTNEPKLFNPNAIDSQYIVVEYNTIVTQYEREKVWTLLRLWIHKRHPIPRPYGRAMGRLFWVLWRKDTVRYRECNGPCHRQIWPKMRVSIKFHYSSVIPAGIKYSPGQ